MSVGFVSAESVSGVLDGADSRSNRSIKVESMQHWQVKFQGWMPMTVTTSSQEDGKKRTKSMHVSFLNYF